MSREEAIKKVLEKEACGDAISRQAVLNYIYNDLGLGDEENGKDVERQMELESSYRFVKSLPPVIPQPKTGHWITTRTFMHDGEYYCDRCLCDAPNNEKWNYCPNCGAKMENEI